MAGRLLWKCRGAATVEIGRIEAEGTGPEIATVFYRPNEIVTLARWTSASAGANFEGDFYQVDAFRLERASGRTSFWSGPEIAKAFGDGYDGVLDGKRVTFPYKHAVAIRARLLEPGL